MSDGHDDKTSALFATYTCPIPLQFYEVSKSQQGTARNFGIEHASGDYALFIGDDIFLAPDACEKHLIAQENARANGASVAVLGFVTWDPLLEITPVMSWLEKSGWQFGYPAILQYAHSVLPSDIQHRYTYTSNISIPLHIAKKHLFRTDVHLYGWEDIEWGMRLRSAGVRLWYEPDAKAVHHHHLTLEQSFQRMETLGQSAVTIAKILPAFDRVPRGRKLLAYRVLSLLPTMTGRHRRAFLRGIYKT